MPIAQFTYLKPGMDVYVTGVDTTTKAKKKKDTSLSRVKYVCHYIQISNSNRTHLEKLKITLGPM